MAFAASRSSGGTSVRRATDCAGPKKLDTTPRSAITRQICGTSRTRTREAAIPARIRSLPTIARFTRHRSTRTPPTGATAEMGKRYATVARATSEAVPCSRKVIRLMTPKSSRKSPKTETSCAVQSVRNPGCRNTPRKLAPVATGGGIARQALARLPVG